MYKFTNLQLNAVFVPLHQGSPGDFGQDPLRESRVLRLSGGVLVPIESQPSRPTLMCAYRLVTQLLNSSNA